jgi:intraflagellar transport protein 80
MLDATKLQVRDHMNESDEVIEFRDDVLLWSLGYGHLIAISKTQCFVHREANNWSTSVTADLRDKCPQFVKQMDK